MSLSTDDPLHFHYTSEPVIEEYGTAAKLLKLSVADLCETARNSVLISGFPNDVKEKWLGKAYAEGPDGNSFAHSHVPTIRLMFRDEVLSCDVCDVVRGRDVLERLTTIGGGSPPPPEFCLTPQHLLGGGVGGGGVNTPPPPRTPPLPQ